MGGSGRSWRQPHFLLVSPRLASPASEYCPSRYSPTFLTARESTGALLPLLLAGDVFGVAFFRKHADWSHLWKLFPWVITGRDRRIPGFRPCAFS
jgi:hypothetical protein